MRVSVADLEALDAPASSALSSPSSTDFDAIITAKAAQYGVDPQLVRAVIQAESNWNPRAVSPKGAKGLMQLMDPTAQRFGVTDAFDPAQNIGGGVQYLKALGGLFPNRSDLVLAAYNAGEGAVQKHGGIPPFPETQAYVQKVLGSLNPANGMPQPSPTRVTVADLESLDTPDEAQVSVAQLEALDQPTQPNTLQRLGQVLSSLAPQGETQFEMPGEGGATRPGRVPNLTPPPQPDVRTQAVQQTKADALGVPGAGVTLPGAPEQITIVPPQRPETPESQAAADVALRRSGSATVPGRTILQSLRESKPGVALTSGLAGQSPEAILAQIFDKSGVVADTAEALQEELGANPTALDKTLQAAGSLLSPASIALFALNAVNLPIQTVKAAMTRVFGERVATQAMAAVAQRAVAGGTSFGGYNAITNALQQTERAKRTGQPASVGELVKETGKGVVTGAVLGPTALIPGRVARKAAEIGVFTTVPPILEGRGITLDDAVDAGLIITALGLAHALPKRAADAIQKPRTQRTAAEQATVEQVLADPKAREALDDAFAKVAQGQEAEPAKVEAEVPKPPAEPAKIDENLPTATQVAAPPEQPKPAPVAPAPEAPAVQPREELPSVKEVQQRLAAQESSVREAYPDIIGARLQNSFGGTAVIHKGTTPEEPIRVTWIDDKGPSGHTVFQTAEKALRETLLDGYTTVIPPAAPPRVETVQETPPAPPAVAPPPPSSKGQASPIVEGPGQLPKPEIGVRVPEGEAAQPVGTSAQVPTVSPTGETAPKRETPPATLPEQKAETAAAPAAKEAPKAEPAPSPTVLDRLKGKQIALIPPTAKEATALEKAINETISKLDTEISGDALDNPENVALLDRAKTQLQHAEDYRDTLPITALAERRHLKQVTSILRSSIEDFEAVANEDTPSKQVDAAFARAEQRDTLRTDLFKIREKAGWTDKIIEEEKAEKETAPEPKSTIIEKLKSPETPAATTPTPMAATPEEPPLPSKAVQDSITRILNAVSVIRGRVDKKKYESAYQTITTHARKLDIPVEKLPTYFHADQYRRIADATEMAIAKKYGSHPTEALRKRRDELAPKPKTILDKLKGKKPTPAPPVAPEPTEETIAVGDIISDGLVRGRVLSEGSQMGKPAYRVEVLTGREKGKESVIFKDGAVKVEAPAPTKETTDERPGAPAPVTEPATAGPGGGGEPPARPEPTRVPVPERTGGEPRLSELKRLGDRMRQILREEEQLSIGLREAYRNKDVHYKERRTKRVVERVERAQKYIREHEPKLKALQEEHKTLWQGRDVERADWEQYVRNGKQLPEERLKNYVDWKPVEVPAASASETPDAAFRRGVLAHEQKIRRYGDEANDYGKAAAGLYAVIERKLGSGPGENPNVAFGSRWHQPLAGTNAEDIAAPDAVERLGRRMDSVLNDRATRPADYEERRIVNQEYNRYGAEPKRKQEYTSRAERTQAELDRMRKPDGDLGKIRARAEDYERSAAEVEAVIGESEGVRAAKNRAVKLRAAADKYEAYIQSKIDADRDLGTPTDPQTLLAQFDNPSEADTLAQAILDEVPASQVRAVRDRDPNDVVTMLEADPESLGKSFGKVVAGKSPELLKEALGRLTEDEGYTWAYKPKKQLLRKSDLTSQADRMEGKFDGWESVVDGRRVWTNGHLLEFGDPPKGYRTRTDAQAKAEDAQNPDMAKVIPASSELPVSVTPLARMLAVDHGTPFVVARRSDGELVFVNEKYWDHFETKHPGITWRQWKDNLGPIIGTADGQVVAAVMPMRAEPNAVVESIASRQPVAETPATAKSAKKSKGVRGFTAGSPAIPTSLPPATPEPISTGEVVKRLSDAFQVPVRKGHFLNRALGIYKQLERVARIKGYGDIAVASHEVAHHLDKDDLIRPLRYTAAYKELKALDYKPKRGDPHEGFAEFLRHYLTRDDAQTVAPKMYDWWVNEFLPKHPAIAEAVAKGKAAVDQWRQEGAVQRVIAQIDTKNRPLSDVKALLQRPRTATEWLTDNFFNRLAPLLRTARQMTGASRWGTGDVMQKMEPAVNFWAYAKATNMTGAAKARAWADFGMSDAAGNKVAPALKEVLAPIAKDLRNPKTLEEFYAYTYARHALDVLKQGKNPGITKADAQYTVQQFETRPGWEAASDGLTQWHAGLVDYLVEAGGLSPDAAAKMQQMYPHYIALARKMDVQPPMQGGPGPGSRFANLPTPIRRLKGSGREILPPLESALTYAERLIGLADKIRVGKMLVDAAGRYKGLGEIVEEVDPSLVPHSVTVERVAKQLEAAGADLSMADQDAILTFFDQSFVGDPKDNILTLYQGGKRTLYWVRPDLYKALVGLDKPYRLPRLLDATFGRVARTIRLGATGLRAGFSLVTNPLRDIQTAVLQSGEQRGDPASVALGTVRGILADLTNNEVAQLWKRGGGEMAQPLGIDRRFLKEAVDELLERSPKDNALDWLRHPVDTLRSAFSVTEAGPRLAEFEAALKNLGWKPGQTVTFEQYLKAQLAAQNVTVDFREGGALGMWVNQLTPFFNASLQGPARAFDRMASAPVSTLTKAVTWLTLPALGLWWAYKDEDWYKNLRPMERYRFWHVKFGDKIVRIPRPFEWGHLFASIPEAVMDWAYRKDPQAITEAVGTALQDMTPSFVPGLIQPAIEVSANRDFYFNRPLIPERMRRSRPEDQANPETTSTARAVGRLFGVPPIYVEHLVSEYTGGLARDVLSGLETTAREGGAFPLKGTRPTELTDVPVIGRLFLRGTHTRVLDDFYTRLERAEAELGSAKLAKGQPPEGVKAEAHRLRKAADDLADLRKRSRETIADTTRPDSEKRQKLLDYHQRMVDRATRALQRPTAVPRRSILDRLRGTSSSTTLAGSPR